MKLCKALSPILPHAARGHAPRYEGYHRCKGRGDQVLTCICHTCTTNELSACFWVNTLMIAMGGNFFLICVVLNISHALSSQLWYLLTLSRAFRWIVPLLLDREKWWREHETISSSGRNSNSVSWTNFKDWYKFVPDCWRPMIWSPLAMGLAALPNLFNLMIEAGFVKSEDKYQTLYIY